MRNLSLLAAAALAACSPSTPDAANEAPLAADIDPTVPDQVPPAASARTPIAGAWQSLSSDEGVALRFEAKTQAQAVHLFCESGKRELLANLPGVAPVGSEERLTVGGGDNVVALVADPRGDAARGGVSARGPVPDGLAAMLEHGFALAYGKTNVGPLPPVGADEAGRFAAACVRKE